jgi:hypothetical protein
LALRVYETQGARGPLRVQAPDGWRVGEALDLLERPNGPPRGELRPFEVRTVELLRV